MSTKPRIPLAKSRWEELFAQHVAVYGISPPVREYSFGAADGRRWRFDFAWPQYQVAVEIQGGRWVGSHHTTGEGFARDAEKHNAATMRGWQVLHFVPELVKTGEAVRMTQALLKGRGMLP